MKLQAFLHFLCLFQVLKNRRKKQQTTHGSIKRNLIFIELFQHSFALFSSHRHTILLFMDFHEIYFDVRRLYIFNMVNNTHCFGTELYSREGKYSLLSERKSEIIWIGIVINFYPRFVLN